MIPATGWFKVFNNKEIHHNHKYTPGTNFLLGKFAREGSCVEGGFYFTDINYILYFFHLGDHIRSITLPTDHPEFQCVQDPQGGKWRANMITLEDPKYYFDDPNTLVFLERQGFRITDELIHWTLYHDYFQLLFFLLPRCDKLNCEQFFGIINAIKCCTPNLNYPLTPVVSLAYHIVQDDIEQIQSILDQNPELEILLPTIDLFRWAINNTIN